MHGNKATALLPIETRHHIALGSLTFEGTPLVDVHIQSLIWERFVRDIQLLMMANIDSAVTTSCWERL